MSNKTSSVTKAYIESIVELQIAKGYTTAEAYMFLAGYLGSHMEGIINQLPKAKMIAELQSMERTTLQKEAQTEVLKEMA